MPFDIATVALVTPVFIAILAEAEAQGLATERTRKLIASTLATAVVRGRERDPGRLKELAMQAVRDSLSEVRSSLH